MPISIFQPVSLTYAGICLIISGAYFLEDDCNIHHIALLYKHVLTRFQAWRLITSFFFLGPFPLRFVFRLVLILACQIWLTRSTTKHSKMQLNTTKLTFGASLEGGHFNNKKVDYLKMLNFGALLLVMAAIPFLRSPFMGGSLVFMFGGSLVFMVVYVWGSMFPNKPFYILGYGVVKGCYIPWCMLGIDCIIGTPLRLELDISGFIVGHVYYFFAVRHPLAGGKNIFMAPLRIHFLCSLSLLVVVMFIAHTYSIQIDNKYGRRSCCIPRQTIRPRP